MCVSVCLFVYLLAVHHVPEAGQRMNPDVNVFVLHRPHGELQRRGQVAAAGCQLDGVTHTLTNIKRIFSSLTTDVSINTLAAVCIHFVTIIPLSVLTFL